MAEKSERVKQPTLADYIQLLRDNGYWERAAQLEKDDAERKGKKT